MSLRLRLLALALGLLLLGFLRPGFPLDLNSDALYLDDLWLSLSQGSGLAHWYFPPAPSFFPDLPLFALFAPASDPGLRHGLYGMAMLAAFAAALACLGKRRFGLDWGQTWSAALAGALLVAAGLALAPGLAVALTPAHHGSALLGVLCLLALAPSGTASASLGAGLAAFLLTALLGFSDRLFLIWGVFPLLLTQASQPRLFWRRERLAWWAWVGSGWVLAELALSRLKGMEPPTVARVRWDYWLEHRGSQELAKLGEVGGTLIAAGWLGGLALAWLCWRAWQLRRPERLPAPAREALACAALSGIASLAAALALGELAGRYLLPFFLLPALLLPLARPVPHWDRWLPRLLGVALGASLIASVSQGRLRAWAWTYPSEAVLLDTALAGRDLGCGFADYWQARRLRLLARSHPSLLPMTVHLPDGQLAPYLWIEDRSHFDRLFPRNDGIPDFGYVLIDGMDREALRRTLGPPLRTVTTGDHELWIYR